MQQILRDWDGEHLIIHYDRPTGAWIFIAIHSLRLGPAGGGTRFKSYPQWEEAIQDALRLAASMSYKFAVSGMEMGGGKAVIAVPADFDPAQRSDLLRRYGTMVHQLNGLFYTGPDVGTTSADMDIIAETGAPYVFGRSPAAGGAGSSGPYTSTGVYAAIEVTCEWLFGERSLRGRRILVQGAGSVGRRLIELLHAAGAEILCSDINDQVAAEIQQQFDITTVAPEAVFTTPCDIFSPCALGGLLNASTIPQLECRAVVGAANNQLATPEDAERLHARGILYAPDYVVNVGGAMAITGIESRGWSAAEAERRVDAAVRASLRQIYQTAAQESITTEAAAHRIAVARLSS